MMKIEPPNSDMNFEVKLNCILKLFILNNIFCSTSTLVYKAYTEDKQYAARWGNDAEKTTTKPMEI